MAKIEDRQRTYVVDGAPVATGVVPLADAWACTNPSLGRGISIGHGPRRGTARRCCARADSTTRKALAIRWHELTTDSVEPLFADTLTFDRHRLAEIEAVDRRPAVRDRRPRLGTRQGLGRRRSCSDPDLLRGFIEVALLLDTASTSVAPGHRRASHRARRPDTAARPRPSRTARRSSAPERRTTMKNIDLGDLTFAVQDEGEGPAVVLLHGFPDSHALVAPPGAGAGRRRLPRDRARPARLRRLIEARRRSTSTACSISSATCSASSTRSASNAPTSSATTGARRWPGRWPRSCPTGSTTSLRCRSVIPSAFRDAGFAQREKSWYMLLFQFEGIAEQWLSADDFANMRAWSQHPDIDQVMRSTSPARRAHRGTQLVPRQRASADADRAATGAPADPVADDGRVELRRLRARGVRHDRLEQLRRRRRGATSASTGRDTGCSSRPPTRSRPAARLPADSVTTLTHFSRWRFRCLPTHLSSPAESLVQRAGSPAMRRPTCWRSPCASAATSGGANYGTTPRRHSPPA